MFRKGIFIILLLILISCYKSELPKPLNTGAVSTLKTLPMGENYANLIGFSFQNNTRFELNMMDWDIYIYPDKSVRLNTARFMKVKTLASVSDFTKPLIDTGYYFDNYNTNVYDFKMKFSNQPSYYRLNLGRAVDGSQLNTIDIELIEINNKLQIKYKYVNESDWSEYNIDLITTDGTFYSFLNSKEFTSGFFTQPEFYCGGYSTRFESENLDYLVRGVLNNKSIKAEIASLENISFNELSLTNSISLVFSDSIDYIGYDWKSFNIDDNIYTVNSEKVFVIKYNTGIMFKMHFISYYNEIGEKGFPVIEYELLE